jgi:hypothetical protein
MDWSRASDNGPDEPEPCDQCPWDKVCILAHEGIDPENICKRACSHRDTLFTWSRKGVRIHICVGCDADMTLLEEAYSQ